VPSKVGVYEHELIGPRLQELVNRQVTRIVHMTMTAKHVELEINVCERRARLKERISSKRIERTVNGNSKKNAPPRPARRRIMQHRHVTVIRPRLTSAVLTLSISARNAVVVFVVCRVTEGLVIGAASP
jgi:hypothetical protein